MRIPLGTSSKRGIVEVQIVPQFAAAGEMSRSTSTSATVFLVPLLVLLLALAAAPIGTKAQADQTVTVSNEKALQIAIQQRASPVSIVEPILLTEELTLDFSVNISGRCAVRCGLNAVGGNRHFVIKGEGVNVRIEDLTLTGGVAETGGSVLITEGASAILVGTVFINNRASGQLSGGGAIEVTGGSTAAVLLSEFVNNFAPFGGAIEVSDNSSLTINRCSFTNNSASVAGGAISIISASTLYFRVSNVTACSAPVGAGINVAHAFAAMCAPVFSSNVAGNATWGTDVLSYTGANVTTCFTTSPSIVTTASGGKTVQDCFFCSLRRGLGRHPPGRGMHPVGVGGHPLNKGRHRLRNTNPLLH